MCLYLRTKKVPSDCFERKNILFWWFWSSRTFVCGISQKAKKKGICNEEEHPYQNRKKEEFNLAISNHEKESINTTNDQYVYLFIEEAIYLYERGLLKVFNESGNDEMNLANLFSLLETHGLSLAAYVTYAHLRSQTFIVLRHCNRDVLDEGIDEIIPKNQAMMTTEQQESAYENGKKLEIESSIDKKEIGRKKKIHRENMRQSIFNAPPPQLIKWNNSSSSWRLHVSKNGTDSCSSTNKIAIDVDTKKGSGEADEKNTYNYNIAFDVYEPNTKFRRSNPGTPNYNVAITDFGSSSPPFQTLQYLIKSCKNIPLRLATVSDSGTVIMFSIARGDVPNIAHLKDEKK